MPTSSSSSSSSHRFEVYYYTAWKPAYVRYRRLCEHTWHHHEMLDCSELSHPGWYRIYVEVKEGMECVFCNADKSCWDNPPPRCGSANYILDSSQLPANYEPPPLPAEETAPVAGTASSSSGGRVVFTIVEGEVALVCGGRPVLVVTDLDGTLLGHDEFLSEFNKLWLQKHVWRGSKLVYNTGRNLKDFLQVAQQHNLHRPAYAIVGVGTELYSFTPTAHAGEDDAESAIGPVWCARRVDAVFEEEWLRRMQANFHRPTVEAIIIEAFPNFSVNGDIFHDPWRMSVSAQTDHLCEQLENLRLKFSDCKLVVSGAGEWRYVDILPQQAGKLPPVEYVMTQLNFTPSQTLVCGDSGNDIDMFSHPEVLGVCVANAHGDLVSFLRQTDLPEDEPHALLLRQLQQQNGHVKPTPNVMFASTSCAGAIVDALKHFGFD
eukprot:GHVS01028280.1.p1 GENE.GHVS01028280.1~~GHVS01028280.1.p1  ORF type:complete len:433 (-),score=97.74 GHVS01028280.1:82-1380(-)